MPIAPLCHTFGFLGGLSVGLSSICAVLVRGFPVK